MSHSLPALELKAPRRIAKLFLSEGTIKQYSNQIYSKLQIKRDTRTKRSLLVKKLTPGASENSLFCDESI